MQQSLEASSVIMSKTSQSTSKDPKDMTKEEFNVFRRKYVYPSEEEVTGGPLNFIKVHSSEPHRPRGRLLREWTKCEGKLVGGCKSGHLGWFVELEDGTIKHAMMMLGEECAGAETVEGGENGEE